jgi:hypothetical protein
MTGQILMQEMIAKFLGMIAILFVGVLIGTTAFLMLAPLTDHSTTKAGASKSEPYYVADDYAPGKCAGKNASFRADR